MTQHPGMHHTKNPVLDFLDGNTRVGELRTFLSSALPAPWGLFFSKFLSAPSSNLPTSPYLPLCIYLPPSLLPTPIPTLSSLPSHHHHHQCTFIPHSWCSYFSCSSLSLLMLLVLLMLFALTPSAPRSCS